jgi:putative FmdB family regulatory protein
MRYDYFCERCQVTEERQVPVDARDEQICGRCGTKLKRLLSRPYFRIPRSFRDAPSDEEFFTPVWQPVRYRVSKRELMKEYDKAIETLRKPPDWLKRLREWEAEGKFVVESGFSPSEPFLRKETPDEGGEEEKRKDRDEKEEIT